MTRLAPKTGLLRRLALAALGLVLAGIATAAARPAPTHIVAFGTSLTANTTWTADLERALNRCGMPSTVTNAAEGATTSRWGLEALTDRVLNAASANRSDRIRHQ